MILKSRREFGKRKINSSSSNPLFEQKRAITDAVLEALFSSILLFIPVVVGISIEFIDKQRVYVYLMELVICVTFLWFFISFVLRFLVFLKLRKVQFSNEQSVSVNCKKILFLLHPVGKHSSAILGIILKDAGGNKFYYVYPKKDEPSDFVKKYIKEQYLGSIELVCYRNTNIVKRLPQLK